MNTKPWVCSSKTTRLREENSTKRSRQPVSLVTVALIGLFASCGSQGPINLDFSTDDMMGEHNNVAFSYSCILRGDVCGFDYALQKGTDDTLFATGDYRLLRSSVSVSDSAVIAVGDIREDTRSGLSINFTAVGVGSARLVITDDDTGDVVDQITLRVQEAADLKFATFLGSDEGALEAIDLTVEDLGSVEILVYDNNGDSLQTYNAVVVEVPDLQHVGLRGGFNDGLNRRSVAENPVVLYPVGAGQTILTASTAEGLSRTIPITVTETQSGQ